MSSTDGSTVENAEPERILLKDLAEELVNSWPGLHGAGKISDYVAKRLTLTHIDTQVLMNAFIQGRHQIGGPYMTSEEIDVVHRAFQVAKAYDYILSHLIQAGRYVVSVNENGEVELIPGDKEAPRHAQWAMKIATKTTEWEPRWEAKLDVTLSVRAKTPEEALEKAYKASGMIHFERGASAESMAIAGVEAEDLRLDPEEAIINGEDHRPKYEEVKARYPEYVKPPFQNLSRVEADK